MHSRTYMHVSAQEIKGLKLSKEKEAKNRNHQGLELRIRLLKGVLSRTYFIRVYSHI